MTRKTSQQQQALTPHQTLQATAVSRRHQKLQRVSWRVLSHQSRRLRLGHTIKMTHHNLMQRQEVQHWREVLQQSLMHLHLTPMWGRMSMRRRRRQGWVRPQLMQTLTRLPTGWTPCLKQHQYQQEITGGETYNSRRRRKKET
jgi:hypothetical protein